ncbi:ABC transporter ATP-binding protein [bacterium]|nr:ABC transporter ATP-binding protein [bacterium]NBX49762.1 ABC transporter ATP-binding protein [bacterium]
MQRPLLHAKNLRKAYGRQVVLDDLSFVVAEGQKIALLGRNGAGKSTLLKILTGDEERDGGEIELLPWTKLGVVRQHEVLPGNVTVQAFFEEGSGKPVWEIKKLAARFGLLDAHLAKKPTELSGGYQMRVKIVAMLLQDPTLLILDEPVNYLDLQTLLLLEKFLAEYRGSFLLTAHDREFLQNTCTDTFEIERGELVEYAGGVEEYLAWKEEQKEYQRKTNKKLAREIAHHQEFVDRFRYKRNLASRAQNKIKHIARLRSQMQVIGKELASARIVIPTPHITAGTAVRVERASIGYGDHVLASDISFEIKRGEKVVIAGENGRGKTTLLKALAGKHDPLSGKVKWWHHAKIGYYDQKTDATLIPHETVLAYLTRLAPADASGERLLMMAGNFLFRNDDLEKTTSVLSGGERARLCLAGILLHEYNVLILDEPTNHLDVETAENLAEALKEYGGTVIIVSHARTFVNALVDRTLELREGSLKEFPGSYEAYVQDLETRAAEDALRAIREQRPEAPTAQALSHAERKALLKQKERVVEKTQEEMEKLDKEKSAILAYFFEYPTDYSPERSQRLREIESVLPGLEMLWLEAQKDLDALKGL